MEKGKHVWSCKIDNEADALKLIKEATNGFFFVAILSLVAGYFLSLAMMIDGLIIGCLALIIRKTKSRIASVLLLLLSGTGVFVTASNLISNTEQGGTNIVLAILVFWYAIRCVEVTFKLKKGYNI